jgi:hypothetical protein
MARQCFCGCGRKLPRYLSNANKLGEGVAGTLRFLKLGDPEPPWPEPANIRIMEIKGVIESRGGAPKRTPIEWIEEGQLIFGMLAAILHKEQPPSLLDNELVNGIVTWYGDATKFGAAMYKFAALAGPKQKETAEAVLRGDVAIPPEIFAGLGKSEDASP